MKIAIHQLTRIVWMRIEDIAWLSQRTIQYPVTPQLPVEGIIAR
jgi:hypothetical protein